MTLRKGGLGIVLAGVAALSLSLAAVSFVVDTIIDSDVRDEMSLTLETLNKNADLDFEFLSRCLSAFADRKIGDLKTTTDEDLVGLRDILMATSCHNWPKIIDGYLLCFAREGDVIVSTGAEGAHDGERAAEVICDFESVRRRPPGEFFTARVYGNECLCLLSDYDAYRFASVVPLKVLSLYRWRALLPIGLVLLVLVGVFTFGAFRRSVLMARLKGYIDGEKVRMKEDLEAARLVQTSALPPPFPKQYSYSVRARMDPAKVVGGDFYDFQVLPNGHFYFLVADVAGKGISAAMFMMRAKSVIKQCLAETGSLSKGMTQANALLAANNDSKLFVTVWVGVLDPRTGHVYYVNAGHNPPVVRRANGGEPRVEWEKCPSSLVLALLPGVEYSVHELTLAPGDTLFLYTDGVTEAQDIDGRFYGERRLEKVLAGAEADFVGTVRASLDAFQGEAEPADDVTMVALHYAGTPPGSARGFPCNREVGFVEAVRFVEDELARANCPPDIRKKFLLAFDEIGSNVISYSGTAYFTVKIAVEATPPAFTLTVSDTGKPFNPLDKAAPDLNLPFEKRVSGGFGIFITRQLMDDVIYCRDEGRNVLTLRKACQK